MDISAAEHVTAANIKRIRRGKKKKFLTVCAHIHNFNFNGSFCAVTPVDTACPGVLMRETEREQFSLLPPITQLTTFSQKVINTVVYYSFFCLAQLYSTFRHFHPIYSVVPQSCNHILLLYPAVLKLFLAYSLQNLRDCTKQNKMYYQALTIIMKEQKNKPNLI